MKFVTFASAADPTQVEAFQAWFRADYARSFVRAAQDLRGCLMRLPLALPSDLPEQIHRVSDPVFSRCDVVFESWFGTTEDYRRAARACEPGLRDRTASFMSYRCTPILEKDPRMAEAGQNGRRPAISVVIPVRWVEGSDAKRHWDEHVPIALRIHRGASKYERNWVDEVMSISRGIAPAQGIADFSFPTIEKFLHEFYPTKDDRREIQRDVEDFIASAASIYLGDAIPIHPQ